MTSKSFLFLGVVVLPLVAAAAPNSGQGTCEYVSENPSDKGLTFCTHVTDEASCAAEARKKSSPDFVKRHPPKFEAGANCMTPKPKIAKKTAKAKRASTRKKPVDAGANATAKEQ